MRFPRRFSFTRAKTDALQDTETDEKTPSSNDNKNSSQKSHHPADRYAWKTLSDHDKYILESFQKSNHSATHQSINSSLHATDSLLGMDDELEGGDDDDDDDDWEFYEETHSDDDHASVSSSSSSPHYSKDTSLSYTVEDSLLIDKHWQRVKTTTSTTSLGGKILVQLHKADPSCLPLMKLPQFTRQTPRYSAVCEILVQTTDMMVALLGPDMLEEEYRIEWNQLGRTCVQEGIPVSLLPAAVAQAVRSVLNQQQLQQQTNNNTNKASSKILVAEEVNCTSEHVQSWIRALEACVPCMQQHQQEKSSSSSSTKHYEEATA